MTLPARPEKDLSVLKSQIDLVGLCQSLGFDLVQEGDRWVGLCPLHPDSTPSFAVYPTDAGHDRAGCWSCSIDEDAFGIVQKITDCDFHEAVNRVREAINGGALREIRPVDDSPLPDLSGIYAEGDVFAGNAALADLWSSKNLPGIDVMWIREEFALLGSDALMIPLLDRNGELVGLKRRHREGKPLSVRGSRLRVLYGSHRDTGQGRVVLCEGESDTWRVAALLRDDLSTVVLGLPSGVAARPLPEWIEQMEGRDVTLLLDADDPGREGARRWAEALEGQCRVATLPDGLDACSASEGVVGSALDAARPAMVAGAPFDTTSDGYWKVNKSGDRIQVSSFTLKVRSKIELDEDIIYEVTLDGETGSHHLPASALASSRHVKAWCNPRERVWFGTDGDAQQLLREMQVQSSYVPRIRGTSVAGWHDGSFVLPEGVIGSKGWAYVPPVADVRLSKHLNLVPGSWDADVLPALAALHRDQITTPILGWIAAAPLRSLCRQFPILAVTGGSGFGKTTLLSSMLHSFGYDIDCVLTATTPHAVQSFGASSNAFPVWFDEYRSGARQDSKLALDQMIRDAWDGKASVKGGQTENRSQLTFLDGLAPLVVTGEDAFSETSHAERMIIVPIRAEGRNTEALTAVRALTSTGLGFAYLSWLVEQHKIGVLPAPPDLPDRMGQAWACVQWGYDLLCEFAREEGGVRMPNLDGSLVQAQQTDAKQSGGPIVQMLRHLEGVHGRDGYPLVWNDPVTQETCIRVGPAVMHAKRETELVLPGNTQAVTTWLTDVFSATDEPCPFGGRMLRLRS